MIFRLALLLIAVNLSGQPMPIPTPVVEDDEPAFYLLQWTQPTPPPVRAWTVRTNGQIVARTLTNQIAITNPVGRWITNSVVAEGTNGLLSLPASLIWSNVFWQKPMTNILTITALMTPARPSNLRVGNPVPEWPTVVLTNPATPGVNLFWIPLKGTNAQLIECRTGAITNNLYLDGKTFTNWPPFVGRGFYWVSLTSTNI